MSNKGAKGRIRGVTIRLTNEQKEAILQFWKKSGRLGIAELKVEVINDKISPASIQVEAPR